MSDIESLRKDVSVTPIEVSVGSSDSATVSLFVIPDQNALLAYYERHTDDLDGMLPLWGAVWPSSLALCRHIGPDMIGPDAAVIELGCGLGLAGIAVAMTCAPSSVLLTDIDPLAVALSKESADRSGVGHVCTSAVRSWHDLAAWPPAAFDVAIGADIIYEADVCAPITAVLAHMLKPGGRFILADGKHGRKHRAELRVALLSSGTFRSDGDEQTVTVPAMPCLPADDPASSHETVIWQFVRTEAAAP